MEMKLTVEENTIKGIYGRWEHNNSDKNGVVVYLPRGEYVVKLLVYEFVLVSAINSIKHLYTIKISDLNKILTDEADKYE